MEVDKFEEMKRILIVFICDRIRKYKECQKEIIEKEDGYFSHKVKINITALETEAMKLESEIPFIDCYSERSLKKVHKYLFDNYFRKACKIEDEDPKDKMIPAEIVKEKLGNFGYELMKEYFSIKAGIICLEKEILPERRREAEKMLKKFNLIKKFWEKEVLI